MGRTVGLTVVGALGGSAALWVVGLDLVHALTLAAALLALIALRRAPQVNPDQGWPDPGEGRSDVGVRREVARLSWSMQGYEARVQRQSARRLHAIAAFRLAQRGLDLDDPRDYLACQAAVGERAYRVISEPEQRPLYPDFVAAVAAVEKLGTTASSTTMFGPTSSESGTGSTGPGSTGPGSTGPGSTGPGSTEGGGTDR